MKEFFKLLIEIRELDENGEQRNKIRELKAIYDQEHETRFLEKLRWLLFKLNQLNQEEL